MNNIQWHLGSSSSAQLQILRSCKEIPTMKPYMFWCECRFICRIRLCIKMYVHFGSQMCPPYWLRLNEMHILSYFFSNLFVSLLFTQDRNPKVLGLGPQGPECKLNPYWSKLRVREKHDVMLFSFLTCPLIPKTLLTQKSDSIFVHRLLRYSIFPHI